MHATTDDSRAVNVDSGKEVSLKEEESGMKFDGGNVVIHCILRDDHELLSKVLGDSHDIFHQEAQAHLNTRDAYGKSPLDLTCILGRVEILKLLIKEGADLSCINASDTVSSVARTSQDRLTPIFAAVTEQMIGYTPVHFAACWGHRECLQILFESGLHIDLATNYKELPKELALRYNHQNCADYIDVAIEIEQVQQAKKSAEKKKSKHSTKKKK